MVSDLTTRLILIRHGESEDNAAGRLAGWTDSPLTARGRQQAECMARYVARVYRPSAVYASSLSRAIRTAEPLAALVDVPLRVRDDLRELYFGEAEGLTLPEVQTRFPDDWQRAANEDDLEFAFPGGEPRVGFYRRTRRAVGDLLVHHPGETVAVISHGGFLSSLLADVAEGRPQRWRSFYTDNCALSELAAVNGAITIVRWNLRDYLSEPEE